MVMFNLKKRYKLISILGSSPYSWFVIVRGSIM